MSARARGTQGYAAEADTLAVRYEALTFEGVQRDVLHLIPAAPCRVLDIGAGTGRDAAALAARGHRVTAAEPTPELRAHAERLHRDAGIAWVDDALPDLAGLRATGELFDLIMATAVWMHLDEAERAAAMPNVAALMAPGGRFLMSLRYGPVPPGRRMFAVPPDETIAQAAACGLSLLHRSDRGDMKGRVDVRWTLLGFEKAPRYLRARQSTLSRRERGVRSTSAMAASKRIPRRSPHLCPSSCTIRTPFFRPIAASAMPRRSGAMRGC